MPRGRKTSLTVHLTDEERQTLLVWQRSTTMAAGLARRGRLMLLLADRTSFSEVSRLGESAGALSTNGHSGFSSRG